MGRGARGEAAPLPAGQAGGLGHRVWRSICTSQAARQEQKRPPVHGSLCRHDTKSESRWVKAKEKLTTTINEC
eukprot:1176773-Prorocentrum_minimum.AAC.3